MKNVYDKINDLDFETDEFELNDIEKERLYMTAKTYKKKSNKKYMAVAAALLLALGLNVSPVKAEVSKAFTDIKVSMMETFGASPESYKYVTELHKPIQIGDDSFILENLAIEDNKMFLNIIRQAEAFENVSPESMPDSSIYKVVINGETYRALGESGSSGLNEDKKTFTKSTMLSFDKDFPRLENAVVDLYFLNDSKSDIVSIKASTNLVNGENKVLAQNYDLENGANIKLMKINPITMTAVIEGLDIDYDYQLEGLDKDGKKVQLDLRTVDDGVFTFIYNSGFSDLSLDQIKDGREITFTLSGSKINETSGKLTDGNYEKVAEFTLSAK